MTNVTTVPKSTPDLSVIRGLPLNQIRRVAIFGGLGDLPRRFLADGYAEVSKYFPYVKCVAIDTAHPVTDAEMIAKRLGKTNLPWDPACPYVQVSSMSINDDSSFTADGRTTVLNGNITAVPTVHHLNIAQVWAPKGIPVWADKPLVMIPETGKIRRLARETNKVFAVDFFMDSEAMHWFIAHMDILIKRIGKVKALHGKLTESWPLDSDTGQADGLRSWLLVPEISGGGLKIDQDIHFTSMWSPILTRLGYDMFDASITDTVMGIDGPNRTVETASWSRGHIGDIKLLTLCGKGLDSTYYGITVVGEHGSVEVFVGTEEVDPYVKITIGDQVEIYHFENGQIGYGRTWFDFLTLVYGGQPNGYSLETRLEACAASIDLVGQAYKLHKAQGGALIPYTIGNSLLVPEPVLGTVATEIPKTKEIAWQK